MKIKTRFYKGEETNPFPKEADEHYFWEVEKQFFGHGEEDQTPSKIDIAKKRGTFFAELCLDKEEHPELSSIKCDIDLLPAIGTIYIFSQQFYAQQNPVTQKPFDYSKCST